MYGRGRIAFEGSTDGEQGTGVMQPTRPNGARGSLRRIVWAAALFVVAVFLLSTLVVARPADAAPTHLAGVSFGPEGPSGPEFLVPEPAAIDPVSGDIYVAAAGGGAIYKFDENATPLSFSGTSPNIEGNKLTGLGFPEGLRENQIAVSPSGTIYANTRPAIQAFNSNGEPSLFTAGPGSGTNKIPGFGELLGVAADANGAIYGADWADETVSIFSAAGAPLTSFGVGFHPSNVAVSPSGTVYVVNYSGGMQSFRPSSFPVTGATTYGPGTIVDSSAVLSVAVDPATEEVYSTFPGGVHEYSPSGSLISTFSKPGEIGALKEPSGIAIGNQLVVVDRGGSKHATIFGPLVTVPTSETFNPSPVGPETATLRGAVNPEGAVVTSCTFEYGTTEENIGGELSVPCSESSAQIGGGQAFVPVHADVTGLAPSQQYFVRLSTGNPSGSSVGAIKGFATPRAPIAPVISSPRLSAVDSNGASVEASIDSGGLPTTYFIEFGPTSTYGSVTGAQVLPAGAQAQSVNIRIPGLTPQTEYHYRIVAENKLGKALDEDGSFRTPALGTTNQSCPNELFRSGLSALLPGCRAYEMVTPVEKAGLNIEANVTIGSFRAMLDQVSSSGESFTYSTSQGFASPEGVSYSSQYLADRTPVGWQSRPLAASQNGSRYKAADRSDLEYRLFNSSLCVGVLLNWSEPALVAPAVEGAPNIYARKNCGGAGLLGISASAHHSEPEVGGISADGSCVVYYYNPRDLNETGHNEGNDDPGGLYERCGTAEQRLDILPDGSPTVGWVSTGTFDSGSAGLPEQNLRQSSMKSAVSQDGSTVYWSDRESTGNPNTPFDAGAGQLFVRINATQPQSAIGPSNECTEPTKACTIPVSGTVESSRNEAYFLAASTNGARAYYTIPSGPSAGKLFEFDLASRSSRLIATGVLAGLAPVIGVSDDGSRLYFFSEEELNGEGVSGKFNLYLFESSSSSSGSTELVASLSRAENEASYQLGSAATAYFKSARVTPDGMHALFTSADSLTGYDNRAIGTGVPAVEVYEYDAGANSGAGALRCISCNPTGRRPEAKFMPRPQEPLAPFSTNPYAGLIPGNYTTFQGPRAITDDGSRIFFESFDALVPRDTNGTRDVYEWTRVGVSGCDQEDSSFSPTSGGCIALVSSGQSPAPSTLIDATADGRDVFFSTAQSLVPQDPGFVDIYDARMNGGFPSEPSPPPACEGEDCQRAGQAPAHDQSGTARFTGPGNQHAKPHRCTKKPKKSCQKKKKRQCRKHQRCVKKHGKHTKKRTAKGGK
jgi:hypothetical protein